MGLDVYVGPLCRYYTQDWDSIVVQAGQEMGIPVEVIRAPPPDDAITDTSQILKIVTAWRDGMARAMRDVLLTPLEWSESPTDPYFTDKPDWDGWIGLQLAAAHQELPRMTLPPRIGPRTNPRDLPLYREIFDIYERPPQRGLLASLGLAKSRAPERGFAHLIVPTMWLPADFAEPVRTTLPSGQMTTIGSVDRLLIELRELNKRQLGLSAEQLRGLRRDGPPSDAPIEVGPGGFVKGAVPKDEPRTLPTMEVAGFGLSVVLPLVETAAAERLPIVLDY
jgi:hypothetical protein